MGRIHAAVSHRIGVVCLRRRRARRRARQRLAARAESGGGRGGGASRARHDALTGPRPRTGDAGSCRRCDCAGAAFGLGPDRRDRAGCVDWPLAAAQWSAH